MRQRLLLLLLIPLGSCIDFPTEPSATATAAPAPLPSVIDIDIANTNNNDSNANSDQATGCGDCGSDPDPVEPPGTVDGAVTLEVWVNSRIPENPDEVPIDFTDPSISCWLPDPALVVDVRLVIVPPQRDPCSVTSCNLLACRPPYLVPPRNP